ncbi:hypothetical protein RhiirA1_475782 [Rhizophagus irregularis]|uniref:Uncharacterized protein n=2 Tax=Rhizophagus irregularis TaxID=588596 RepID=A0A2N0QWA1_9GLOM|nr:hypothetical protein RhiirA1_475782 [Rhizophagus irregularis]
MKNSLFENENDRRIKRYYLMIELKKIKSYINSKGKKTFWYNIIWILKEDNVNKEEEILMSASYEIHNENEFKILIRSIIIGLILINGNSEIILGINENIKKLIKEFIFNTSNRKKIDSDYYIELLYIEDFMRKNGINIIEEINEEEAIIMKDIKKRMEQILEKDLKEKKMRYKIEIIENALLINEYNLIWKKNIITGGFRNWRKKVSMALWKNEILNSNKLNDLFILNFKKEFDWRTTLEFISNQERSIVLPGKSRIWEMLRGVFNERFNHLTKSKEELMIIKECWNFIYKEIKTRIWLIRCEEVARLEKLKGIQKQDLRKKKRRREPDQQEGEAEDENTENKKTYKKDKKKQKKEFDKKINIVTRDRLIGAVTDGNNIEYNWDLTPKSTDLI